MPQPLSGSIQPVRNVTNPYPLAVKPLFAVALTKINNIQGVPALERGSLVFPAVSAWGWLVLKTGWDTRGTRRGRLSSTTHGAEDSDWTKK